MHPPWLPLCPVVLYLIAGATVLLAADNVTTPVQEPNLQVRCSNNYTMTCVKRDVLLFLDAMDGERSYELYPGFTLFQRRSPSAGLLSNNESLDAANSSQLDHMIAKRLNDYVESIDLRVRLLNPINATARSVGNSMLERILPFLRMSRKKKDHHHGLYWAAGTMAAIGTSALMALSSKALMTAGAALALAIYSCMKGGGGGKGGGSHLTATLMEESTLVPHRQCAEAVVDVAGLHNYPADVERYPGSRKTVDIVSPAMPVYRIHQTSEDYPSSYGSSQPQSQAQYP